MLFVEEHEIIILLDHSSGRAQKRMDLLDSHNMTKGWDGKVMRPILIKGKDGFLGSFCDQSMHGMVQIGFKQSMVYSPGDLGTFELRP